jgi:gamma-tubulin complex component 2
MLDKIEFGMPVALMNAKTGHYLRFDIEKNRASADGIHPFARDPSTRIVDVFYLVNHSQKTGSPTLGQKVFISTEESLMLTVKPPGELALEALQSTRPQGCVWAVCSLVDKRTPLEFLEEVVISSVFNSYLCSTFDQGVTVMNAAPSLECCWKMVRANLPPVGKTLQMLVPPSMHVHLSRKDDNKPLAAAGAQQENLLLEDLLNILMGFDGKYIKRKGKVYEFVNLGEDPSSTATQMAQKFFPLALMHGEIREYVRVFKFGQGNVCSAFTAVLSRMLKEFTALVTDLDDDFRSSELSLQRLWFQLQQTIERMGCLCGLVRDARMLRGGALLHLIYRWVQSCREEGTARMAREILASSALPFIGMLEHWVYRGLLEDPYCEFMIQARKEETTLDLSKHYWVDRFVVVQEQVPEFLLKLEGLVLDSGKYLNLMELAGQRLLHPGEGTLLQHYEAYFREQDWRTPLQSAHDWASKTLTDFVTRQLGLFARLQSLKGYFFMEYGDLFTQFIDAVMPDLDKNIREVQPGKLEAVLAGLTPTSSASQDPFRADVRVRLSLDAEAEENYVTGRVLGKDEKPDQRVVRYFSLDYRVQWPMSLLVTRTNLIKYQTLFRYFFHSRVAEQALCSLFNILKQYKKNRHSKALAQVFLLTQRMLSFVKNRLYNFSYEVIEKNWQVMLTRLRAAQHFGEMLQLHSECLDECLRDSLLLEPECVQLINALTDTCMIHAQAIHKASKNVEDTLAALEGMHSYMLATEKVFEKNLKDLLAKLAELKGKSGLLLVRLTG